MEVEEELGIVMHACSCNYSGGLSKKITWTQEFEASLRNTMRPCLKEKWKWEIVQPLCTAVWLFPKKLNMELSCDPAVLLLGMHWKEPKGTGTHTHTHTHTFIATLLTTAERWKQPARSSRWKIKKLWYNGTSLGNKKEQRTDIHYKVVYYTK
jgi:hypothetical protein